MLLGRWSPEGEVCTEYSDACLSVVWWEACLRKAWCLPDTILPKAFTFPAACLIPDSWVSGENPMISHQEGIAIFILNAAVITGTCGQTCWNFGTFKSFGTAVPRISLPTKKTNCGHGLPGEPQGGQRGRQVILHSHQLADSTLELEFSILIFVFTFIWLITPCWLSDIFTLCDCQGKYLLRLPHSHIRKWRCSCLSSLTRLPVLSVYLQASSSIDDCPMSY